MLSFIRSIKYLHPCSWEMGSAWGYYCRHTSLRLLQSAEAAAIAAGSANRSAAAKASGFWRVSVQAGFVVVEA